MENNLETVPRTAHALARGRQTHRWTVFALGASVALNLAYPVWYAWREDRRQQMVVFDTQSATLLACPVVDAGGSDDTTHCCLMAALCLFDKSAIGFRYPEILRLLFNADARKKAQAEWEKEAAQYKAKSLKATVDVKRILPQPLRYGRVNAQLDCIVSLEGRVNGQPVVEDRPVTVNFQFARNDDLLHRGRYGLMVIDYSYATPAVAKQ
jgi:hypothetical protein